MADNVQGFAFGGAVRDPVAWLGRNFCLLTAKLQKIIRITKVEWRYSSAQLAQSRLLAAALSLLTNRFHQSDYLEYLNLEYLKLAMRIAIPPIVAAFFAYSCSISKNINYSFKSESVVDSIVQILQRHEINRSESYRKTNWFALMRETDGAFEVIINERFGDDKTPFNRLIKKTNRFLLVAELRIPVLFETDLISSEFQKFPIGYVNWGGYYFKIVKENSEYKVVQTSVLF